MVKNYAKITMRNFARHKLFSAINICGLAVGLAVSMLILFYVAHEYNYDRFHVNSDKIVTLRGQLTFNGNTRVNEFMSYSTAPQIKAAVPNIEDFTRYFKYFLPVTVNSAISPENKFKEEDLLFADEQFFHFFSFKLISGNSNDALSKPFSVVISKDMADKYFSGQDPVGKTLMIKTDSLYSYIVTGVAENNPSNSSIKYNFVASANSLKTIKGPMPFLDGPAIGPGFFNVYFQLRDLQDTISVRKNIQSIKKEEPFNTMSFSLPSLTSLHLSNNSGDTSNVKYLRIFPVVAIFILLLALVNYMSISTAQSTIRAKEVGVRKVAGASRKSIALQFYFESSIFACISFVLGYSLCYLFRPWFLNLLHLKIDNAFLYSPTVLLLLLILLVLTIVIAGSYPAFILSSFNPIVTLRGAASKELGGVTVRKVFTVLQFSIAVGLIICGVVINRQIYFFRHVDTGINRGNVMYVSMPAISGSKYEAFKNDVKSLPGVAKIGTSNYTLFDMYDTYKIKRTTIDDNVPLTAQQVDTGFISTFGLKWKIPPVSHTQIADPKGLKIAINESAVEKLHLPANPVGNFIESDRVNGRIEIVGVLKDFNFKSMQYAIEPFGLFFVPDDASWDIPGCVLYIKFNPRVNLPSFISSMKEVYKKHNSDTPFTYSFVDEAFDSQYKAEEILAGVFSIFTLITISLASLGLFGLAAFTIQQRTKEIGIRKVLGASLFTITILLSKDFLRLVAVAILIASPVAWLLMHNWLQKFEYRIGVEWWIFIFASLVAVFAALSAISYNAIKAAIEKPVKSLKGE